MDNLRSYPGVLSLLLIAAGLLVHGLIEYVNYEVAGPSVLAALGCLSASLMLVGVYRFKSLKTEQKSIKV